VDYRKKSVLVTGAASGIGRALVLRFADLGASLLLTDIDRSGLEAVSREAESRGATSRWYLADVSDAEQVERLWERVSTDAGVPDILINSAGVAEVAALEEAPLEDWHWVLGVNLWGCIHTMHYFLPGMYARGSGHVVNMASAAGLFALAYSGMYTTSKFAVVGLTETLRSEASVHGVGATVVCPGFIDTPLLENVKSIGFEQREVSPFLRRLLTKPDKLAVKVIECIEANRPMLVCPLYIRVMLFIKRIMPMRWDSFTRKQTAASYKMRNGLRS
jgi:NAD(P)-dependent dehydrogenase (short-subunit alcohol dehydrogenase family)